MNIRAERTGTVVVYDWLTTPEFLAFSVVGPHAVIPALVRDTVEDVMRRVPDDADCFLFHLNCTITRRFPVRRTELIQRVEDRGIRVLNQHVTDISKLLIQDRCIALGLPSVRTSATEGQSDDMVIVKSNLNYGGANEWALSEEERALLGVGQGSELIYEPNHYRVRPRWKVEAAWWTDPQLVCEKFVENAEGRWFRGFILGKRFVLCELTAPEKIKKVGGSQLLRSWMLRTNESAPSVDAPDALRVCHDMVRLAQGMQLDFGAIDAMMHSDGTPYIVDVNTTPAYYHPIPGLAEHLGAGLR